MRNGVPCDTSDKITEAMMADSATLFGTVNGKRERIGFEWEQPTHVYSSSFLFSDFKNNTVLIRKYLATV